MKLLFCKNCKDVFSLSNYVKNCTCGHTKGRYSDKINATFSGTYAVPLGFNNRDFLFAVRCEGLNTEFKAFTIEENCPTFVRVYR